MITLTLLATLASAAPAGDGAFSADGAWLAYEVGGRNRAVHLVQTAGWTRARTLSCGCTDVEDVTFSPDGSHVAARTSVGPLLWRVADGASVPIDGPDAGYWAVAWLGERLAVAQTGGIVLVDPQGGPVRSIALEAPGAVRELLATEDGLVAVSRTGDWTSPSGQSLSWLGLDGAVRASLDVSDDGARNLGPGFDGWVVYESVARMGEIRGLRLEGDAVRRATLSRGPEDWKWIDGVSPLRGPGAVRSQYPRFLADRRLIQVGLGRDRESRLQWTPPSWFSNGGSVELRGGAPLTVAVAITQVEGRELAYVATSKGPVVYETASMTRVWE